MKTKTIIIDNELCDFCHFPINVNHVKACTLKSILKKREINDTDIIPFVEEKGYVIPEWCPLKKYNITFKLENK